MTVLITDFLVKKLDLQQVKFEIRELDPETLLPGQMLCKANNFA